MLVTHAVLRRALRMRLLWSVAGESLIQSPVVPL
jgi:hypothetical protein